MMNWLLLKSCWWKYKFIEESHKNIMDKMESFQMQVEFTKESIKQHNLARDEVLGKRRGKEEQRSVAMKAH